MARAERLEKMQEAILRYVKTYLGEIVSEINLSKADGTSLTNVEVRLEFEQKKTKGFLGGLKDKYQPADPDLMLIAFKGSSPVDYVEPKDHRSILDGAVNHRGDARGKGQETVSLQLANIHQNDSDITSFALGVICGTGFDKIAGAVVRFFDVTLGESLLGNSRFDITGQHTASVLGFIERTGHGWKFREAYKTGYATDFTKFADLARTKVGR